MRAFAAGIRQAGARHRRLIGLVLITASLWVGALAHEPDAGPQEAGTAAGVTTVPSGSGIEPAAVQPAPAVELDRILGEWYEIARIPAWFQSRCIKDTTARYQLRNDGKITVINRCTTRRGQIDQAEGLARIQDPASKSRLKVSFVSVLGWRPFWGDYWIIGLDPQYRWLVVGDPKRQYGWILSRSSTMDAADLEAAFRTLDRNGYTRERFALTPQS